MDTYTVLAFGISTAPGSYSYHSIQNATTTQRLAVRAVRMQ